MTTAAPDGGNTGSGGTSRDVHFSLRGIHEHLLCRLCFGYFREPYTVTECLHTFCRSCLNYATAAGCNYCVICKIYLGNDVEKFASLDFSLQRIVDTIVMPDVLRQEADMERLFYQRHDIPVKPQYRTPARDTHRNVDSKRTEQSVAQTDGSSPGLGTRNNSDAPETTADGNNGLAAPASPDNRSGNKRNRLDNNDDRSAATVTSKHRVDGTATAMTTDEGSTDNEIDIVLIPELTALSRLQKPMPRLSHPCIRVSDRLKMSQVKKYLRFLFKDESLELEVLCNSVPLGDEICLGFIRRLVWAKETDLELTYRTLARI